MGAWRNRTEKTNSDNLALRRILRGATVRSNNKMVTRQKCVPKTHYNLQFLLTRQNESKIKIVNCKSKFHSRPKHQLHKGPTRKLFCSAAARFDASSCISRATAKHKLCQKNENNEFKIPTRGARSDSHAHAPKCEASSPRATITHGTRLRTARERNFSHLPGTILLEKLSAKSELTRRQRLRIGPR